MAAKAPRNGRFPRIFGLSLAAHDDDVDRPSGHRRGLYFGSLLLAWWLIAAASGPNPYARVQWFMGTAIGRLLLFGYTWALLHHMLGGIRHLIWDIGYGFGPSEREWLTAATLVGSIVLTILLWVFGYFVIGGAR